MARRSKSSHAEQASTIASPASILQQTSELVVTCAPALAGGTVIFGGVFYCGSIITSLNDKISSLNDKISTSDSNKKDAFAVERELIETKFKAERNVIETKLKAERNVIETQLQAERDLRMKELQAERDLRLKDKELADTKIYGLALLTIVGGSCAVIRFCFG